MSKSNDSDVKVRLKQAWKNFEQKASKEQLKQVQSALQHHSNALINSKGTHDAKSSEFSLAKSIIEDSLEKDIAKLFSSIYPAISELEHLQTKLGIEIEVLGDGEIVGTGKYEVLDIDWLEAVIIWLENYFEKKRTFPKPGTWFNIPDITSIAIFGDWGGGTWKDNSVAKLISNNITNLKTDINIHLGDVYYAGEPDQEQHYLLDLWPAGKKANFTLNSNHEMYPLGKGYFDTSLKNPLFKHQDNKSFFALENKNWIIVGLDSAFDADTNDLYLKGNINQTQIDFLKKVAAKNKKVIVLSHHNPLDITGQKKQSLWSQVVTPLNGTLKYWYWGHIHGAAVYDTVDGVSCRLSGHGVIPWGNATSLQNSSAVSWYEHKKPQPADGVRVQNGFTRLSLTCETLTEEFYGEDNEVHWPINN